MENDATICGVCGGARSDHFDADGKPITQHVFSSEGRLQSQADAQKAAQGPQQGATRFVMPAGFAGTDAQSLQRLIEVLLSQGVISEAEVLYIFGVASKPDVAAPTGYNDPVKLFGTGTC